jgi:hypothetical protein
MGTSPLADDPPFSRIPMPPSRLIGRERELALALGVLRRPDVRLLTLSGAGGIGKNRLALEIAGQIGAEFADGVRYVALAPVLDARLVAPTVARAVGLHDASDEPVGRPRPRAPLRRVRRAARGAGAGARDRSAGYLGAGRGGPPNRVRDRTRPAAGVRDDARERDISTSRTMRALPPSTT